MTQEVRVSSLGSYRDYEKPLLGNLWSDALEADLRETVIVAKDGSVSDRTPARISRAIVSDEIFVSCYTFQVWVDRRQIVGSVHDCARAVPPTHYLIEHSGGAHQFFKRLTVSDPRQRRKFALGS
jgi:hypothetical protein